MITEREHNGFKITFNEKEEQWYANLGDGEFFHHTSLAKLKEALDKKKKGDFDRIPIFVLINRYGSHKEWTERYGEATITSVSPNGNAYYVEKGSKHAQKEGLRYGGWLYEDTKENRKLIAEYHALSKKNFDIEAEMEVVQKKMKKLDGEKLFKSIYGRAL